MKWYYANAGRQEGPVNEAEFQALVLHGTITPSTLVWHEGLPNWVSYSTQLAPTPSASLPPTQPTTALPRGQVQCAECRRIYPSEEVIQLQGKPICARCKPLFVQKLQEGVTTAASLASSALIYAPLFHRVLAYLLDYIILQAVNMIFVIPVMIVFFILARTSPGGLAPGIMILLQILLSLGGLLIGMFYTVFFLQRYAATPGKMVFRLVVVRADGSRLSTGRCYGRYFASLLSGMICCIGYLLPLFDEPMRRALHDHLCDTRVIVKSAEF